MVGLRSRWLLASWVTTLTGCGDTKSGAPSTVASSSNSSAAAHSTSLAGSGAHTSVGGDSTADFYTSTTEVTTDANSAQLTTAVTSAEVTGDPSDGGAPDASAIGATDATASSSGDAAASGGSDATTSEWNTTGTGPCTFEVSATLSETISTVGIVEWSVDMQNLTEARIEFTLDAPEEGEIAVSGGGVIASDEPQALLLGLKPGRSYTYRVVVTAGETVCVSPEQKLTTESDEGAPAITQTLGTSTAAIAQGYVLACSYGQHHALIFDADGDVVWWVEAPTQCSRALMDWDGKYMWMLKANPSNGGAGRDGAVWRQRMDGSELEVLSDLEYAHHDFAVLPQGGAAFLIGDNVMTSDSGTFLVERAADGTFTTLTRLDGRVFGPGTNYHANALRYYAWDDSYSVSDRDLAAIAKLNRQGEVMWSTRSSCEEDPARCVPLVAMGTHGNQLLPNGNLLYFGVWDTTVGEYAAHEYDIQLDATNPAATLVWSHYEPYFISDILGDVQRLPSGNTIVVWHDGHLQEVSPEQEVVRSLEFARGLGYVTFRSSLYGPPQE